MEMVDILEASEPPPHVAVYIFSSTVTGPEKKSDLVACVPRPPLRNRSLFCDFWTRAGGPKTRDPHQCDLQEWSKMLEVEAEEESVSSDLCGVEAARGCCQLSSSVEWTTDGYNDDDDGMESEREPTVAEDCHSHGEEEEEEEEVVVRGASCGKSLRNRKFRLPMSERARQKRVVLQAMVRPLKRWLIRHRKHPYPTRSQKLELALAAHMTLVQVSNWFANARRRLKSVVSEEDCSWEQRVRLYNSCLSGNAERLSISSDDSVWDSARRDDDVSTVDNEILSSDAESEEAENEETASSQPAFAMDHCYFATSNPPGLSRDQDTSSSSSESQEDDDEEEKQQEAIFPTPPVSPQKYKLHLTHGCLTPAAAATEKRGKDDDIGNWFDFMAAAVRCQDKGSSGKRGQMKRRKGCWAADHLDGDEEQSCLMKRRLMLWAAPSQGHDHTPPETPQNPKGTFPPERHWEELDAALALTCLSRAATL